MNATTALVERFTRTLGRPVSTPDLVRSANGRLVRSRYRVNRWRCPACLGGYEDAENIYKPLVVDSDGRVFCEASGCSAEAIGSAVRALVVSSAVAA